LSVERERKRNRHGIAAILNGIEPAPVWGWGRSVRPGPAMPIAESEDGRHAPAGVVASIGEAGEIAERDRQGRMRRRGRGDDPGLGRYAYGVRVDGMKLGLERINLQNSGRNC
jgi:hypothetical protein